MVAILQVVIAGVYILHNSMVVLVGRGGGQNFVVKVLGILKKCLVSKGFGKIIFAQKHKTLHNLLSNTY